MRRARISSLPAAVSKYHCAFAVLLERNWEGVVVGSDHEDFAAVGLFAPAVHGLIGVGEVLGRPLVLGVIAGEDKVRGTGAEDRQ